MYAISIREPFASAMRIGLKKVETRSWKAPDKYIGKWFYIHAPLKEWPDWQYMPYLEEFRCLDLYHGKVIAKARLIKCIPTEEFIPNIIESTLGFYEAGRYAWVFDNITQVEPFEAKGRLGIWEIDER